jgi:hypothetical protein
MGRQQYGLSSITMISPFSGMPISADYFIRVPSDNPPPGQAAGSGHLSKEFNDAPFSAANSK